MTKFIQHRVRAAALGASALVALTGMADAQQVFTTDVIVQQSLCVGFDCASAKSFGSDTIRLKENNLRIKAEDTSNSSSFPGADWQITFNDSTNGGLNKFSIDDIDSGRTPFTIEANVRTDQLYLADNNRVGFGTSAPVVDLHVRQGNTPTLRLEQDGSSGFAAQTWDLAGNETNFFLRDVTGGSQLPFRVAPGADTNSISISATNDVGMGIQTAEASLHVRRTGATQATVLIEAASADSSFVLEQLGAVPSQWEFRNQAGSGRLNVGLVGGNTPFKIDNLAANNLLKLGINGQPSRVEIAGTLAVSGSITVASQTLNVPDYVFEPGYALRPLSEVAAFIDTNGHLPGVPSAADVTGSGQLNLVDMQLTLLEKVEELTLYTLAQEDRIAALTTTIAEMKAAD